MILRRHYFLLTGLTVAIGLVVGGFCRGADQEKARLNWSPNMTKVPERTFVSIARKQTVPVLAEAELLVVGTSLDGCFIAERAANNGQTIILVSSDTSLPHKIAIGLRPWLDPGDLSRAPDDIKSFFMSCTKEDAANEIILDMIKVTECLEDRILNAGVGLFYDLHPCGVQMAGKWITAVIFACKGGLVAIEAKAVIDCTPDARVAGLAGAEVVTRKSAEKGVVVRYSMLCSKSPNESVVTVGGVSELVDNRILMHGDFAEFLVRVPMTASLFHDTVYGLEARRVATDVGAILHKSPTWETTFVRGGDAVLTDPVKRIVSRSADKKLSLDACRPKGINNLVVCGPTIDVDDATAKLLTEPLQDPSISRVINKVPWRELFKAQTEGRKEVRLSASVDSSGRKENAEARFIELSPVYRRDTVIAIEKTQLPVIAECEVLVVGAGTSGMPAALVASEKGADTIVVEKYGDVGGTHTIGGVSKFWFGRETDFVNRLNENAKTMMRKTGMPKCMGMLDSLMNADVNLLTHCIAVGAVVENRTVIGVVVVTPSGLAVIKGKRVIDATGDGDIVARAGAKTDYGTRRDAMTLWYSFAQYCSTHTEAARHYAYTVDPRDPMDMTRAMIVSRRHKKKDVDFPQYYLTTRESRHIRGGYRITVADILSGRRFEDVALVCKANFDIKGIADSDLFMSGYIEWSLKNYSVQIPYRALVPMDLENILVVGKAYSVTHDALALARMQRDLMAMGGVAGLASVQALKENKAVSEIDIKALQAGLVKLGVLTACDINAIKGVKDNKLPDLGEETLRRMVAELAQGNLPLDGQVKIMVRPEQSIPMLKEALSNIDGKAKVELARALCFLGEKETAGVLLADLERQLEGDELPTLIRLRHRHSAPEDGRAPMITFQLNTLARMGDTRIIPLLVNAAQKVKMNPKKSDHMFNYVFSICYAAERLGNPACMDALAILARKPGIHGGDRPRGSDPRKTVTLKTDRYAYLELCVGRAMARCGSRQGYYILLNYLQDIRAFLARSAHDELVDLSGRDLGYDKDAWLSWLSSEEIAPKPYRNNAQTLSTMKANNKVEVTR